MKLILLSDVHISSIQPMGRQDNYFDTGLMKLDHIYSYANSIGATVLQAGDLVDRPRDWLALPRLIALLKKYPDVETYMVVGQHDMYMRSRDSLDSKATTVGILNEMNLLKIIGVASHHEVGIYGAGWNEETPPINYRHDFKILIIHAPISMGKHPGISTLGAKNFAGKNNKFDVILCGDIHISFSITSRDTRILNTGSLLRKEANKYNFKHRPHFFVLDTDTGKLTKKYVPCDSAEDVLSRDHIERETQLNSIINEFVKGVEDTTGINQTDVLVNLYLYMDRIGVSSSVKEIIERIIDAE